MSVDVDSPALGLLKQELEIIKIVAGNDDEGALFHCHRNLGWHRMAEGFGIGLIQQRHAPEVDRADLHYDGQQTCHIIILAHCAQRLIEEGVDFRIRIAQHGSVIGIGRHAAHAEEDQGFEGTDILIRVPEQIHIVVVVPAAGMIAGRTFGNQALLLRLDSANQFGDSFIVEIHVGNGSEQAFKNKFVGFGGNLMLVTLNRVGKADQRAGEPVLQGTGFGLLAANARVAGAGCASGGLFALEAKHLIHGDFLLRCGL